MAVIGKSGTEAASDLVANTDTADQWFRDAHLHGHKNVEILLYTDVVDGSHGPPHIIDTYTW